jgi:hypothetical protein
MHEVNAQACAGRAKHERAVVGAVIDQKPMGQSAGQDPLAQHRHQSQDVIAQGEDAGHDGARGVIEQGDEETFAFLASGSVDVGTMHGVGEPEDLRDPRWPAAEGFRGGLAPAAFQEAIDRLERQGSSQVALDLAVDGGQRPVGVLLGQLKDFGEGRGVERPGVAAVGSGFIFERLQPILTITCQPAQKRFSGKEDGGAVGAILDFSGQLARQCRERDVRRAVEQRRDHREAPKSQFGI